ncbi:membrane protein insertion efficiency factor YidD [Thermodesulfobacteriota bacterium]
MNRSVKIILLICFVSFFILSSQPPLQAEEMKSSAETDAAVNKTEFSLAAWFVSLYRDHLSAVDSDRCPSVPSCAGYSVSAFKKHGFVMGWMMTVDRLIHEGREETKVSPLIFSGGKWKIYDPVENNDFWWFPEEQGRHE